VTDVGELGLRWEGVGAISGGGATTKLLMDYDPKVASDILDYLFLPNFGLNLQILKVEVSACVRACGRAGGRAGGWMGGWVGGCVSCCDQHGRGQLTVAPCSRVCCGGLVKGGNEHEALEA
jgi:hypothetical protein